MRRFVQVIFGISLLSCGGGEAPALFPDALGNNTSDPNVPVGCGNGTTEPAERCDDFNSESGDCCAANCTLEPGCGWTGATVTSECLELSATDPDACEEDGRIGEGWQCTTNDCDGALGDGIVRGQEQCDDGAGDSNDGCSATGTIEAGYGCSTLRIDASSQCSVGFCDDGNLSSGDGCSASGQIEPGYACVVLEGGDRCDGAFGDGASVGSEQCDDGNLAAGDGCFRGAIEAGFACDSGTVLRSQCTRQCDDGNDTELDGCTDGQVDPGASCEIQNDGRSTCSLSARCTTRGCYTPNEIVDGNETDLDCGGGQAPTCPATASCRSPLDCRSGVCAAGTCQAPSASDGVRNGDESDIDCGGSTAAPCPANERCESDNDCESRSCEGNVCQPVRADDGIQNGDETDIDCGGANAPSCAIGGLCLENADCSSIACVEGQCVNANCADGELNDLETDIDCGGGACPRCDGDLLCLADTDCISESCPADLGRCDPPRYDWVQGGFGACDVTCGPGTLTQTVVCERNDGLVVDDALCAEPKPPTQVDCEATVACVWSEPSFGTCSVGCGDGEETRTIECTSPELGVVDDEFCDAGARPASSRPCSTTSACEWSLGSFSACSDECAGGDAGTRTRTRACLDAQNGTNVDLQLCIDILGDEPASEACQGTGTPGDDWTSPAFGACNVTCGDGFRSRPAPTCTNACGCSTPQPPTTENCSSSVDCEWRDQESDWSACSATCQSETGTQTRSLVCINPSGSTVAASFCADKTEPATSRSCSGTTPPGVWRLGPPLCGIDCVGEQEYYCDFNESCGCPGSRPSPVITICCDCPPGDPFCNPQ